MESRKIYCYDIKSGKLKESYLSVTILERLFRKNKLGFDNTTFTRRLESGTEYKGFFWSYIKYDNYNKKIKSKIETKLPKEEITDEEQAVAIKNEILIKREQSIIKDYRSKELSYFRRIGELETRLETYEGLQVAPIEYKITSKIDSNKEATAIGELGDIHMEERVDKKVVNGLNEYNPDIAIARVNAFFRNFVFLTSREQKNFIINDAVLYLLGDNISGYIHEELKENNYLSPLEAITLVRDTLFNGLKYVIDNCKLKTLYVVCKFGNHARLTERKSFSTGYKNNLDYFCYKDLERVFRLTVGYENIKFIIEDGELTYFDIYNYTTRCGHGDHFKYAGGIGGLVIPLMRKLKDWDSIRKADMTIFGHWHRWIPGSEFSINGSVIGITPYGLNFAQASDLIPKQTFMLCVKSRGFTTRTPIFLD